MTGVLLVNMGGANSPSELKIFLARMFKDPFILPLGKLGRNILSFLISNTRYKKSWKKYELIGGSPIIEATHKTMKALQNRMGDDYNVKMAFSYSSPLIKESLLSFINEGVNKIIVIPLYPQSSISTTSSVEGEVNEIIAKNKNIRITFIREFYKNEGFVNFWSNLILDHINHDAFDNPFLMFSAHSIPEYLVAKGDTYPKAIKECAEAIAGKLNYKFEVAFQSGMKKDKWIGPDLKDKLKELSSKGINEIIIVPISFVNENLETLYDLDHEIIPFGKIKLGIRNLSRVSIPVADALFINLLRNLIETNSVK